MNVSPIKSPKRKSKLFRTLVWISSVIVFIVIAAYVAFKVSPWPSVLLIRYAFHKQGSAANEKLARYVPQGVTSKLDLQYDDSYGKMTLDLYFPPHSVNVNKYPLIVWVHGGGFVAGNKSELANYCKILASKGFIVAAANYSRAPGAKYPVPVIQINTAIAFLVKNGNELNIDTSRIILAGDSGGAHIAAQLANIFTNSAYSGVLGIIPSVDPSKLKGAVLFCGAYNTALVDFEGEFAWFLRTVLWSYSGKKDFKTNPDFKYFSVSNFVTPAFPKAFISVGNRDPLSAHSHDLASRLSSRGVAVDSLFFPDDYSPGLPHEYQFDLDNDAGKLALEKTLAFLAGCVRPME